MHIVNALVRHERRIRVIFDAPLAPAGSANTGYYAVRALDGAGVPIAGLVLVAGQPNCVELALGADLEAGTNYRVSASGVPGADGTTSPPDASVLVAFDTAVSSVRSRPASDLDALLYGVDLVWAGADYAEDASGDLATITGPANVEAALDRRLTSDGLPWDDTYGAKPRAAVDGAPLAAAALRGVLVRQAQADDRVRAARATLVLNDAEGTFDVEADLLGGSENARVTVNPNART